MTKWNIKHIIKTCIRLMLHTAKLRTNFWRKTSLQERSPQTPSENSVTHAWAYMLLPYKNAWKIRFLLVGIFRAIHLFHIAIFFFLSNGELVWDLCLKSYKMWRKEKFLFGILAPFLHFKVLQMWQGNGNLHFRFSNCTNIVNCRFTVPCQYKRLVVHTKFSFKKK